MKKSIKQIIETLIIIVIFFLTTIYYINFKSEGNTSFVIDNTVVYKNSELTKKTMSLKPGDSFDALMSYADTDAIKIRYTDPETKKSTVGFIRNEECFTYKFPSEESVIGITAVLSVRSDIEFRYFLELFTEASEEYDILGVYLEDSDYSESKYDIMSFCEVQKIPYGTVSYFSRESLDSYEEQLTLSNLENSYNSYEILPKVFCISAVPKYSADYLFKKNTGILDSCIIQTTSMKLDSNSFSRYWIDDEDNEAAPEDGDYLIYTSKSDLAVDYAIVSTEFEDEVYEKFSSVNENLNR